MGRDYKKYIYPTVSILIGSPVYQALMADLQRTGKKQVPAFIESRLERYYEIIQGGTISSSPQPTQPVQEEEIVPDYIEGDVDLIDAANDEWPE